MTDHGKKYQEAKKQVVHGRQYSLEEAVKLLKQIAFAKFNETVELHGRLGIDPRQSDQQVRTTVLLPAGLGKTVRVLVFAEGEAARYAEAAGADYVAGDEMINKIRTEEWTEFDVSIAVPDMMRKVGGLGKVLGRKGLMPNPKAGTVVNPEDLERAVREARAGRVEFRNDRHANIHVPLGKIQFTEEQLIQNTLAVIDALRRAKPATAKGTFVRSLVITTTMSPGIRLDANTLMNVGVKEIA
ncbi:MAG: 50S ribosomal protein L1 [Chloroflexi bacterium CFX4]|nr:50S ribosomal protein L1 [Chloroflexi bacterium CFX4]MDL1923510.1 50S ribosomal protein L1 [Chloroflexi bacterium CFX3]